MDASSDDDDGWTYVGFASFNCICAVSVSLCTWSLCCLCKHRVRLRQRLFWYQIVALLIANILWCLAGVAFKIAELVGIVSKEDLLCEVLLKVVSFFEFTCSLLGVMIAAGFAASCRRCCTSPRSSQHLVIVLLTGTLLSFPAAAALALQMHYSGACICEARSNRFWSIVVLSCCSSATSLYGYSVWATSGAPRILRRRALLRSLGYLISFVGTFGPHAVQRWRNSDDDTRHHDAAVLGGADDIISDLLYLNGAANAGLYALWIYRAGASEERAATAPTVSSIDAHVIDSYFDIHLPSYRDGGLVPAVTAPEMKYVSFTRGPRHSRGDGAPSQASSTSLPSAPSASPGFALIDGPATGQH